jgi:hypothetical protein
MLPVDKLSKILSDPSLVVQSSKPPTEAFTISRGDVLRALIVQKLNNNEVLLETNGTTILAESNLSLNVGDTLQLKVVETHPRVILSLTFYPDGEEVYFKNNLAVFRSFPQGMLNLVKEGLELLQGDLQALSPFVEKVDRNAFQNIINSLIFSEKSLDNPLFLKQFITNMGYLIENSLGKYAERSMEKEEGLGKAADKSLKKLLSHFSSRIQLLMADSADSKGDPKFLDSLKSLSNYVDSSLDTIYNQQVVNVMSQEENQGYYFQIPIKYTDDLRIADLYINLTDRKAIKNKGNDPFQFVMFLNMDALGDVMVDIKYEQKKIWGTFKCSRSDSCDFMQEFLSQLNDRLNLSGYGPNSFHVYRSSNLAEEQSAFIKDKIIFSKEIINCFA